MELRPRANIQKVLISTTSRFVGEYEREAMLITHAWSSDPKSVSHRLSEGPASRNAFLLAFETAPEDVGPGRGLSIRPNYAQVGNLICAYLALLFGKRFDNHGALENDGLYRLPDLTAYSQLCDPGLPQNSHGLRADFPMPLDLGEVARLEPLLACYFSDDGPLSAEFLTVFYWASKFYLQALHTAEQDFEAAYLHLITAGEILSSFPQYEKKSLLSPQIRQYLDQIEQGLAGGDRIARDLLSQMHLVKRKFTVTITGLTDPGFFERSESAQPYGRLKADSFEKAVKAAYDLRSHHVHTGRPFGMWAGLNFYRSEVQHGEPVVDDKEFGKILAAAPTYIGLERIIRHCLLRFAQQHGAYVEPTL